MRKCGRESRTAVCSSTGILTRPNARDLFQSARGMGVEVQIPNPNSQHPNPKENRWLRRARSFTRFLLSCDLAFFGFGTWDLRSPLFQRPFSLNPIVEVLAVVSA